MNALEVARSAVEALEEKKGENIVLMDIHEQASFADYFVICTGTSDRMIDALAEYVRVNVKQKSGLVSINEGKPQDGWMIVDFGDVVVHLFSADRRDYYRLEQLWDKSKVLLRLQ